MTYKISGVEVIKQFVGAELNNITSIQTSLRNELKDPTRHSFYIGDAGNEIWRRNNSAESGEVFFLSFGSSGTIRLQFTLNSATTVLFKIYRNSNQNAHVTLATYTTPGTYTQDFTVLAGENIQLYRSSGSSLNSITQLLTQTDTKPLFFDNTES